MENHHEVLKTGGTRMKKKMGIVLLLGIILGGAGMIYYSTQSKMTMGQAIGKEEVAQKLCTLEGNVVRIEIKRDETTILEKEHQNWENPEHMDLTYDWQAVHEWLVAIRKIESKEAIYKVEDEAQYGIDDKSLIITLYDEMNRSQTFKVGKITEDKQLFYMTTDRMEGVYAVAYNDGQQLLRNPNTFVVGNLKIPELENIEQIKLTHNEEYTLSLKKLQDLGVDKWSLMDYYKGSHFIQTEVMEQLFETIKVMKIDSFAGAITEKEDYGLTKPQLILGLNQGWELSFGKTEGDLVYVRMNDQSVVYTMKKEALEQLTSYKPFDIISREVLELPLSGIKQIVLENPQGTYNLTLEYGEAGQVATEIVSQLDEIALNKEQTAELISTISSSIWIEAALQNPEIEQKEERKAEITITCTLQNNQEEKIELIPYDINYYILRVDGVTEFAVNKDKVTKLFSTLSHMKKEKK